MKPQKKSVRRTVISFGFALATALMALYVQHANKEFVQHSKSLESSTTSSEVFNVNTID